MNNIFNLASVLAGLTGLAAMLGIVTLTLWRLLA